MVSDEIVPHVSPLYRFRSVAEFKADLDFFLRRRRPLSLSEFLESVRRTGLPPQRSFLLTFDDGFREMHDVVAPILQAKGVPAVFFLTSATIDNRALCHHQKIALLLHRRALLRDKFPDAEIAVRLRSLGLSGKDLTASLKSISWAQRHILDELAPVSGVDFEDYAKQQKPFLTTDQARALLDAGMELGAHSIDHPLYGDLPLHEQLRQTRESMEMLVQRLGVKRRAFAFPHTDRNVSKRFFDTVFSEHTIDVSFGTSAPEYDRFPGSFQRFSMEKTNLLARELLAQQAVRRFKLRCLGQAVIDRN